MKISLNLVNQYCQPGLSKADLVDLIGRRLGEVETTIDVKARYQNVLVAKVVDCQPHPNADNLKVCLVDSTLR